MVRGFWCFVRGFSVGVCVGGAYFVVAFLCPLFLSIEVSAHAASSAVFWADGRTVGADDVS